jgi:hypothetical protein
MDEERGEPAEDLRRMGEKDLLERRCSGNPAEMALEVGGRSF